MQEPKTEQRNTSWKLIGPGIVAAATGVGSGDLVATLVAGENYGYALLWAVIVGCIVKISLAEATGRWHLATGTTIFDGWRSLGLWTFVFFAPYIVIWGFVYGATAMSATALPLAAMFPAVPLPVFAIIAGISGLVFVWFNQYPVFEKVMTVLVGVMFVTVVGLAVYLVPNLGGMATGLVPTVPEGSLFNTLGLIGGVGGTITMAAYGFWVNAKGWRDSTWIKMMRMDNRVAYITTGVFVLAMLVVGAELLRPMQVALADGDQGLITLAEVLREEFGPVVSILFLIGFFAAAYTSLIGVWHGVSLMFADFVRKLRGKPSIPVEERETSKEFRAYLIWLTFPPMLLLILDEPIQLIIAYGVLGSAFMPFLAFTLMWLLNTRHTPKEWRNGIVSNVGLAIAGGLFLVLCVNDIYGRITGAGG
ncbi:Nramp family divalent metal transporter [Streptomonospora sp. S1-112]|uniref:Nramp family divalent metal transporter n=1 Tax=Streptomonospora mangrovi TaxID=2883123 RepID=A0A9X3NU47_9ACTN|nr:Nramp family divalent metal transporter [Streptomonospora mangrovi]MDA0564141.1 Nramp family divalent metal transporter [Streptomonospora mangrovi]